MRTDRRRATWAARLPEADGALRASVLRVTARDARTYGFLLSRFRAVRRLSLGEQAAELGVREAALVFLSVFRLPRPAHREQDLASAATALGVGIEVLRKLLAGTTAPTGGVA